MKTKQDFGASQSNNTVVYRFTLKNGEIRFPRNMNHMFIWSQVCRIVLESFHLDTKGRNHIIIVSGVLLGTLIMVSSE